MLTQSEWVQTPVMLLHSLLGKIWTFLSSQSWCSVKISLSLDKSQGKCCVKNVFYTSYFGNYGLRPKIDSPLCRDRCRAIGGWMGGEGRVSVPVERGKKYRVRGADAPLEERIRSVSAAEWGKEGWLCLYKRRSLHSICPQSCDGL